MGAPQAVLRVAPDTLLIATTQSIDAVDLASDRRWTVHANRDWWGLYINSIIRYEGSFFLGGRHFVIEVREDGSAPREFWWVRQQCREQVPDAGVAQCTCVPEN
jgi:hypothetical protein